MSVWNVSINYVFQNHNTLKTGLSILEKKKYIFIYPHYAHA